MPAYQTDAYRVTSDTKQLQFNIEVALLMRIPLSCTKVGLIKELATTN